MGHVTQLKRIGIITGIEQETKLLRPLIAKLDEGVRPILSCADMDIQKAADLAQDLVAEGVSGLISFGVAGGLALDLKPGDLILPRVILKEDAAQIETDDAWLTALLQNEKPRSTGPLISSPVPVTNVEAKAALARDHGAVAVDMESHAIAEVALKAEVPFIAVRVIVDGADMAIPEIALAGTPFAVMKKAVKKPGDIPALLRLGSHMNKATKTLSSVAGRGLPFFSL